MPAAAEIADFGLEARDPRGDLAADLAHPVDADAAARMPCCGRIIGDGFAAAQSPLRT